MTFVSLTDYCNKNSNDSEILYSEQNRLYYLPPAFDLNEIDAPVQEGRVLTTSVARFNNVEIIGNSDLVLCNDNIGIYELFFLDSHKKARYKSDGGIVYYRNGKCIVKNRHSNIGIDEAILLTGNFSFNFYHFLFEDLVKFSLIEKAKLPVHIPLLVEARCCRVPQFLELISYFNQSGRQIIQIEKGIIYKVRKLYHVSSPHFLPPDLICYKNVFPSDYQFDFSSLKFIRARLLESRKHDVSTFPVRMFLSRKGQKGGKVRHFNEDEIFNVLKDFGFVKFYPEEYSMSEQIAAFNNADFIAGGTGAAFSNILFCKPGCVALIFTSFDFKLSIFSSIAGFNNSKMLYISDKSKKINQLKSIHESFHINPEEVERAIQSLILKTEKVLV